MNISTLIVVASVALGALGCGAYPYGILYNGTTIPHGVMRVNGDGTKKVGSKQGESCAEAVLSLVAWGDASIAAAKEAGKLEEVHSVEFREFDLLHFYQKGCTVVHGE